MPTTSNFGWTTPADTDLVKDGAAAIRTLGNGIDTSFLDLKGGTSGQVLAKNSNTDLDFVWVAQDDSNAIQNAIVDAKGDLISATAADTPARLAVGTNGQVLTADSTTSTGLKWATAAAGSFTKIHSSTFSAVSSKSVTDCFSSTYENYKIIFTISAGSNSASIRARLSTSGTDNTTSNYYNGNPVVRTDYSTANNASGGAASYFDVGRIEANSTQIQGMCFDFMQPELAKRTIYGQSGFGQDATSGAGWAGGGGFDGTTQFQGITFYTTAGTMTGSIAIYGYEK